MCQESLLDPITSLEEFALPVSNIDTTAEMYCLVSNAYFHKEGNNVLLSYEQLGRLFFDHLQLQVMLRKEKRTFP